MKIILMETPEALGIAAAGQVADVLRTGIERNGRARIVLSTGKSQFALLSALTREDVDWSRVEMFHLDEYMDLPETHPASFRKYLRERFIDIVHPGKVHLVDGTRACIAPLTEQLRAAPIDIGLIGIGENAHIAFNDPPADLTTDEAYIIVQLDARCRAQQVGEGWFPTPEDVPTHAISMSVKQILACERIVSFVPYAVKACAVRRALEEAPDPMTPAAYLRAHKDYTLYIDRESANDVVAARIRF